MAASSSLERTVPLDHSAPGSRERIDGRWLGAEGGMRIATLVGALATPHTKVAPHTTPSSPLRAVFAIPTRRNRFKPSIWPGAGSVM